MGGIRGGLERLGDLALPRDGLDSCDWYIVALLLFM
jgi:hypothetical protein